MFTIALALLSLVTTVEAHAGCSASQTTPTYTHEGQQLTPLGRVSFSVFCENFPGWTLEYEWSVTDADDGNEDFDFDPPSTGSYVIGFRVVECNNQPPPNNLCSVGLASFPVLIGAAPSISVSASSCEMLPEPSFDYKATITPTMGDPDSGPNNLRDPEFAPIQSPYPGAGYIGYNSVTKKFDFGTTVPGKHSYQFDVINPYPGTPELGIPEFFVRSPRTSTTILNCENIPPTITDLSASLDIETYKNRLILKARDRNAETQMAYSAELVEAPEGATVELTGETGNLASDAVLKGWISGFWAKVSKDGNYKFKVKVTDGYGGEIEEIREVYLYGQRDFKFESVRVAQAAFLDLSNKKLIKNKPIMARVRVRSLNRIHDDDNKPIGVKATLLGQSGSSVDLVGCFTSQKLKQLKVEGDPIEDDAETGYVNLYQSSATPNLLPLGAVQASVTINPLSELNGVSHLDCGATSTAHVEEQSLADNEGGISGLTVEDSPSLSIDVFTLKPPCRYLGSCQYSHPENIESYVNSESDYVRAMFPVNPDNVSVTLTGMAVPGFDFENMPAPHVKALNEICGKASNPNECRWAFATLADQLQIRSYGLNLYKNSVLPENKRFLAIVGSTSGATPGYFQKLANIYDPSLSTTIGLVQPKASNVLMVTKDTKMTLAHELVHSYGVDYDGDYHQPEEVRADGYWVDRLNSGLEMNKKTFMADTLTNTGHESFWMDYGNTNDTYPLLYSKLVSTVSKKIKYDGPEIHLMGMVDRSGQFHSLGAEAGVKPGVPVEAGEGAISFVGRSPAGNILAQINAPYTHEIIADGPDGTVLQAAIAPVSVGLPYESDTFSIQAVSPTAATNTFFPVVEILRQSLSRVPIAAFYLPASARLANIDSSFKEVESLLASGDFAGAGQALAGEVKARISTSIRNDYVKDNSSELSVQDMLARVETAIGTVHGYSTGYPTYGNGLFRVTPQSLNIGIGQRANFSAFVDRLPSSRERIYSLKVSVDGARQKASKTDEQIWVVETSRLSAGSHSVSFQMYEQERSLTESFFRSIGLAENEILVKQRELKDETDPEKIALIQSRIEVLNERIVGLELEISRFERPVGNSVSLTVQVQ